MTMPDRRCTMFRAMRAFAALAAGMLLAGCAASRTPRLDSQFGDAVRIAFAQQRLHAVAVAAPPDGIDGAAAAATQQRYQKSFNEPAPQQSPFVIGVSGSK